MVVKKKTTKKPKRGKSIGKFGAVGGTYLPSIVIGERKTEVDKPFIRPQIGGSSGPRTVDKPYIRPQFEGGTPRTVDKPFIPSQPQMGSSGPRTVDKPYIRPQIEGGTPRTVDKPFIRTSEPQTSQRIPNIDYQKAGSSLGLFGKKKSVKKAKTVGKSKYRRTIREKEKFLKHVILFER